MSPRSPFRRLVAGVALLVLLAAACTSNDESETATETTAPVSAEVTTASVTETGATASSSTTAAPPEVELTASFRGVTADTIKLGYSHIDFETLNATYSLGLPFPDYGPIMAAYVDDLNRRGGILGRQIELVLEQYMPVGTTTADVVCAKLVEDEEVFAVLGGFAGPGAEDVNTCITGVGETILVGGVPNEERLAQSRAPWVTAAMNASRRGRAFVDVFAATGELEALGTLSILAVDPDQEATAGDVVDALTAEGIDVPVRSTILTSGDPVATAAETEIFLEKARAEGVDSIILVGVNPNVSDPLLAANEFTIAIVDAEQAADLDPTNLDPSDRLVGTASIASPDDGPSQECVAIAEEALGIEIVPPLEEAEDDLAYWGAAVGVCRTMMLFEAIATEAGPDLTNDSFRDAIGTVELPPLPVYTFASLGPDKFDARDTLSMVEWDHDLGDFVEISEPFDVGG